MAFKMKGFPMHKGVKMHRSALPNHVGIPKDKDPEGWSMYHTTDGTPRPTEHVKQIVELMNQGMSAQQAISAVEKRGSEIKEDDQSPTKQKDDDKKKDRQAKRASKKEERITDPDGNVLTTIKKIEDKYTRKQILANEGGSQDRLRKLYEKLYPGEEYIP